MTTARATPGPTEVDPVRMQRDRLARTRQQMRQHQLAAVLLFDPLNVRHATVEGPFTVFNLHSTFRWALVPAGSAPVLWEYPQARHVTAARWDGDLRRRGRGRSSGRGRTPRARQPGSPPRSSPSWLLADWRGNRSGSTGWRPSGTRR